MTFLCLKTESLWPHSCWMIGRQHDPIFWSQFLPSSIACMTEGKITPIETWKLESTNRSFIQPLMRPSRRRSSERKRLKAASPVPMNSLHPTSIQPRQELAWPIMISTGTVEGDQVFGWFSSNRISYGKKEMMRKAKKHWDYLVVVQSRSATFKKSMVLSVASVS